MGAASLPSILDTKMEAQVSTIGRDVSSTSTVTLQTMGNHFLRTESSAADGISVSTMNDKEAWTKPANGPPEFLPRESFGGGITHIPLLSVLSDWSQPGMRIDYLGLEKLDAFTVHHIRLTPAIEVGAPKELESPSDIYIDQQSLFVLKMIYLVRSPNDLKQSVMMEVAYQDYKVVSGIAVPYHVIYTIHGQPVEEYRVSSFVVNVGIQENTFSLK